MQLNHEAFRVLLCHGELHNSVDSLSVCHNCNSHRVSASAQTPIHEDNGSLVSASSLDMITGVWRAENSPSVYGTK